MSTAGNSGSLAGNFLPDNIPPHNIHGHDKVHDVGQLLSLFKRNKSNGKWISGPRFLKSDDAKLLPQWIYVMAVNQVGNG